MRSSQCSLLFEYANFSMQRMCFIKWIRAALPFGVNVNQYYTRFCIVKAHCWLRMICGVSVCWPFCVYAYRNQRWIMRFNNRNTDVFVCWCCMPYQKIAYIQYKRNNYVSRAHVQPVRIVCVWMYLHEFDVCIAGSSKSSISISGQCRPINLISNTWNTAVITQKESLCRILLIKKKQMNRSHRSLQLQGRNLYYRYTVHPVHHSWEAYKTYLYGKHSRNTDTSFGRVYANIRYDWAHASAGEWMRKSCGRYRMMEQLLTHTQWTQTYACIHWTNHPSVHTFAKAVIPMAECVCFASHGPTLDTSYWRCASFTMHSLTQTPYRMHNARRPVVGYIALSYERTYSLHMERAHISDCIQTMSCFAHEILARTLISE